MSTRILTSTVLACLAFDRDARPAHARALFVLIDRP